MGIRWKKKRGKKRFSSWYAFGIKYKCIRGCFSVINIYKHELIPLLCFWLLYVPFFFVSFPPSGLIVSFRTRTGFLVFLSFFDVFLDLFFFCFETTSSVVYFFFSSSPFLINYSRNVRMLRGVFSFFFWSSYLWYEKKGRWAVYGFLLRFKICITKGTQSGSLGIARRNKPV